MKIDANLLLQQYYSLVEIYTFLGNIDNIGKLPQKDIEALEGILNFMEDIRIETPKNIGVDYSTCSKSYWRK